jgi:hypothetical protein
VIANDNVIFTFFEMFPAIYIESAKGEANKAFHPQARKFYESMRLGRFFSEMNKNIIRY